MNFGKEVGFNFLAGNRGLLVMNLPLGKAYKVGQKLSSVAVIKIKMKIKKLVKRKKEKIMKRTFKQMLVGAMCLLTALNAVACGGGGDDSGSGAVGSENGTEIYIANFGGGVGEEWLRQAGGRFADSVSTKSYETGKMGVKIEPYSSTGISTANMASDGYSIYFTEKSGTARQLSQTGVVLDISDIVTEKVYDDGTKSIIDKVDAGYVSALKGVGDAIYALPHYEIYPMLTYNRAIFDDYGIYFAKPDSNVTPYSCAYGSAKMVGDGENLEKSCGIDGEYGTFDDGLPTSIQELLIFCNYMYNEYNVVPFTVAGGHIDYYSYFVEGIMSSIMGANSFKGMFSFDTKMDIVNGYSAENLLPGVDIKAPNIEKDVQITDATGYKVRETAARYYAIALTEIFHNNNWMAPDSSNGNVNASQAQANFIKGGVQGQKKVGMLIEGSQWVNEAIQSRHFENFTAVSQKQSNLGVMPFPVSLNTTVTEGNGARRTAMDFGMSYMFVNKKVESNPGLCEAVKDFIQFLYSEEELQNFTKTTGVLKAAINYDYFNAEVVGNLNSLQKEIIEYRNGADMAYQTSDNPIFYKNLGEFILTIEAPLFSGTYSGNVTKNQYLGAVRAGKTTKEIFETRFISESDWNTKYLGE